MKFFLTFLILFMVGTAQAYVRPLYTDIKPASQAMLEKQAFGAPIVTTTNYILTTNAGPVSAAVTVVSTFAHQPDVPRNLTVTPTGTTGDVEACVVTISGTNYYNKAISEDFTFLADASTAQTGSKAFKSVTSISWAANCESGGFAATWIVGVGEKIGLKSCMQDAGAWFHSARSGVKEATAATVVADTTHVEGNTADFNGTMDGTATFRGYYEQNFLCKP